MTFDVQSIDSIISKCENKIIRTEITINETEKLVFCFHVIRYFLPRFNISVQFVSD